MTEENTTPDAEKQVADIFLELPPPPRVIDRKRQNIGRGPYLDAEKQTSICAILAMGMTHETAAAYVGCHRATIYSTAKRQPAFAAAIKQAVARFEIGLVRRIYDCAIEKNQWHAATWLLSRRFPQRYAARRAGTVTPEQVDATLREFAKVVSEEAVDAAQHERMLKRIQTVSKVLKSEARLEHC